MVWKDANQKTIPQPGWFADPSLSVHRPTTYRAYFLSGYPSTADDFWKGILTSDSLTNNKRIEPDSAASAAPQAPIPPRARHTDNTTRRPPRKRERIDTEGVGGGGGCIMVAMQGPRRGPLA